jgi:Asp-tRNA(Asn)/Glu-tRNA(Gln) amidotransferase A subunit family amidase
MARSAADVRLLFEVLAGHDYEDPFSAPVPLREPELHPLRVGVLEQIPGIPVQAPMRHAVKRAADLLEALGVRVVPFSSPELEQAPELWWFFFGRLNAPLLRVLVDTHEQDVHWTGVELMHLAEREPKPAALEILENLARRDHLRAALLRRMRDLRVLLLPACGITAFPHRQREWPAGEHPISLLEAMAPATPFNLLGFPAVVVPVELTPEGLPVGMQLAGRPWEEELILELAVGLEEARGPFPAPPGAAE